MSLFIVFFFGGTLIFLSSYGVLSRTFSKAPRLEVAARPRDIVKIWEESGVRGRVLLLFDRHLNADPIDPLQPFDRLDSVLKDDNFVAVALRKNIVRKVYHVVPDSAWGEVGNALKGNPYVDISHGNYVISIEGSRVLVGRLEDLRPPGEKVLLHINGDYMGDAYQRIISFLGERSIASDIITLSGSDAENALPYFRQYH